MARTFSANEPKQDTAKSFSITN